MRIRPLILLQPTALTLTDGEWNRRRRAHSSFGLCLRVSVAPSEKLIAQAELLTGYLREENHFAIETGFAEGGDIHLGRLSVAYRPLTIGL